MLQRIVLPVVKLVKKASFHFCEDPESNQKWIYFVNHKDWLPSARSVICINHFEEKMIKRGKINHS